MSASPEDDAVIRRSQRLKKPSGKSTHDLFEKLRRKRGQVSCGDGSPEGLDAIDLTRSSLGSPDSGDSAMRIIERVVADRYSDVEKDEPPPEGPRASPGSGRSMQKKKKRTGGNAPRTTLNSSRINVNMEELRRTTLVTVLQLESELKFKREDWLEWSGPKLSSRGLDYLHELNKQWKLSSNVSGRIKGKMKNFITIAATSSGRWRRCSRLPGTCSCSRIVTPS